MLHTGSGTVAAHREAVAAAVANLDRLPDVLSVADPLTTPGAVSPAATPPG